jgi:hypothetical protein
MIPDRADPHTALVASGAPRKARDDAHASETLLGVGDDLDSALRDRRRTMDAVLDGAKRRRVVERGGACAG